MINQITFRKSWYSNLYNIFLIAAIPSLVTLYYTTKNEMLLSPTIADYLSIFLFVYILFFLATYVIAYVVYRLDHISPVFTHSLSRSWLQTGLLSVCLPIICLCIVYLLYWIVFAHDLTQSGNLDRDFIAVLVYVAAVQVYFKMKHIKLERLEAEKIINELKESITVSENEDDCQIGNLTIRFLDVLAQPIKTLENGKERKIFGSEVQELYRTDVNKRLKNISAKLVDGNEVILNYPSLTEFEKNFKHLTFPINRNHLISYMAIADLKEEAGKYYVIVRGQESRKIILRKEKYQILKSYRSWYFNYSANRKTG